MLILAIDTAAAACAAALWRDGGVSQTRHEIMPRGQDARLIPLLQEMLAAAGTDFPSLDRIAVLRGPGSFTGIRIGLATARGLGLALGKPVLGIDRFHLYRDALRQDSNLLTIIDSKRKELFCKFHHADGGSAKDEPPFLANAAQLAAYDRPGLTVCGDGAALVNWRAAQFTSLPHPETHYAAAIAARVAPDDPEFAPLPLYLRPPDVSCGPAPPAEEAPP